MRSLFFRLFFLVVLYYTPMLANDKFKTDNLSNDAILRQQITRLAEKRFYYNQDAKIKNVTSTFSKMPFLNKKVKKDWYKEIQVYALSCQYAFKGIHDLVINGDLLLASATINQQLIDEKIIDSLTDPTFLKIKKDVSERMYYEEILRLISYMKREDPILLENWYGTSFEQHILKSTTKSSFIKEFCSAKEEERQSEQTVEKNSFYEKLKQKKGLCDTLCNLENEFETLNKDKDLFKMFDFEVLKTIQDQTNHILLSTFFYDVITPFSIRQKLCTLHIQSKMNFFKRTLPIRQFVKTLQK